MASLKVKLNALEMDHNHKASDMNQRIEHYNSTFFKLDPEARGKSTSGGGTNVPIG